MIRLNQNDALNYSEGLAIRFEKSNKDLVFQLYAYVKSQSGTVSIIGLEHTCRTQGALVEAMMVVSNLIECFQSNELCAANFLLVPHYIAAVSIAEISAGITKSPMLALFYNSLLEQLNQILIQIGESSNPEDYWYPFGFILKNLVRLKLSNNQRKEMISCLVSLKSKILPLLKKIITNADIVSDDGMGNFATEVKEIISSLEKSSSNTISPNEYFCFKEKESIIDYDQYIIENDFEVLRPVNPFTGEPLDFTFTLNYFHEESGQPDTNEEHINDSELLCEKKKVENISFDNSIELVPVNPISGQPLSDKAIFLEIYKEEEASEESQNEKR